MLERNIKISDELLAAYIDGNVTAEEARAVIFALQNDSKLREEYEAIVSINEMVEEESYESDYSFLPVQRLAAESEDSLCDIACEEYILNLRGLDFDISMLTAEALENRWLKEKGMPLHHIGRLLESKKLVVVRKYEATVQNLCDALNKRSDVIVVVNSAKLDGVYRDDINPNHAVVVLEINKKEGLVRIFNPSSIQRKEIMPLATFESAWNDSHRYMVEIQEDDKTYTPHPIDLSDIRLDNSFIELRESIAENAHENWSMLRKGEGWVYGPQRDDKRKRNPDLVPYSKLSEGEKDYDRNMAVETIKLVKKLGYEIIKVEDSDAFRILMHRMKHLDDVKTCSKCGRPFFLGQAYCECCGEKIKK